MATVIDRLKTLGYNTDYQSRKNLYEQWGLGNQYGGYGGTAQQNLALAGLAEGGKPSPQQAGTPAPPSIQTGQTSQSAGFSFKGMTPLQQQYVQTYQNQPSQAQLYEKYSQEMGLPAAYENVGKLNQTILDLEGKIKNVEPSVKERTQNFFVTEAQRARTVTAEELPLRDQYLESMRRKQYEEAGLSAKEQMLGQRLQYAAAEADRPLELLKTLIAWQDAEKTSGVPATLEKELNNALEGMGLEFNLEEGMTAQQAQDMLFGPESESATLKPNLQYQLPGADWLKGAWGKVKEIGGKAIKTITPDFKRAYAT